MIGFGVSGILYYYVMNKHINTYENSRGLASFSDYQNTGMKREKSNFTSNYGDDLNGYFYSNRNNQEYKGVIIVNNGFGSGHEAMLGEIQALIDCGYLVYGFDKTGYDNSEGNGIGSLSQGVDDLSKAIEHVKKSEKSMNLDIILYGKSYGAYCCLAVLNSTNDVSKVISMSAFNKTSDILESEATRMVGKLGVLFVPFLKFYDCINEKPITACDGILKTDANIIIMHSIDDKVVSYKDSYSLFKEKSTRKTNMNFILYENKGHDIIKSEASVHYNKQMDNDLQVFANSHNGNMTEELWAEFLAKYDLKKCTEPDNDIIKQIKSFLK